MKKANKPASIFQLLTAGFLYFAVCSCQAHRPVITTQTFRYALSLESTGYSDIKKLYTADSVNAKSKFFESTTIEENHISLKAHLLKTIINSKKDERLVCYQIIAPALETYTTNILFDKEREQLELEKPFFVLENSEGRVIGIRIDSSITSFAASFQKEIISSQQIIIPVASMAKWVNVEENPRGVVEAEYTIEQKDSLVTSIRKEVKKYKKFNSRKSEINGNLELLADYSFRKKTLDSCSISSAEIAKLNKDTISAIGSRLLLKLIDSVAIPQDSFNLLSKMSTLGAYTKTTKLNYQETNEELTRSAYKGTLGADNWKTLFDSLTDLNEISYEQKKALTLKCRALFYLQPPICTEAVREIEKMDKSSTAFQLIINALSITESEAACDAITAIIINRLQDKELTPQLLPALATSTAPTQKSIAHIFSLAFTNSVSDSDFITTTAQLTVAAMVKNIRLNDPLFSKAMEQKIIRNFQNTNDTLQFILVMGNLASGESFNYLKKLVEDKYVSMQFKEEAVLAMEANTESEVGSYLNSLLSNKDKIIVEAAKKTLEAQTK